MLAPELWILTEEQALEKGLEICELPSRVGREGVARLLAAGALVGHADAEAMAVNRFLLSDALVHRLKLEGVVLGEGGEFPALSSQRWLRFDLLHEPLPLGEWQERWETEDRELLAIILTPKEKQSLLTFLKAAARKEVTDIWQLADITDRFFHKDSIKLATTYTAPRLNRA